MTYGGKEEEEAVLMPLSRSDCPRLSLSVFAPPFVRGELSGRDFSHGD